jgi:hypothetical protein
MSWEDTTKEQAGRAVEPILDKYGEEKRFGEIGSGDNFPITMALLEEGVEPGNIIACDKVDFSGFCPDGVKFQQLDLTEEKIKGKPEIAIVTYALEVFGGAGTIEKVLYVQEFPRAFIYRAPDEFGNRLGKMLNYSVGKEGDLFVAIRK